MSRTYMSYQVLFPSSSLQDKKGKNFLHFSFIPYFAKWDFQVPSSKDLYFSKKNFSYISGGNFPSPKIKKVHSEEIFYISPKKVLFAFWDNCWWSCKIKKIPHTPGWLLIKHNVLYFLVSCFKVYLFALDFLALK